MKGSKKQIGWANEIKEEKTVSFKKELPSIIFYFAYVKEEDASGEIFGNELSKQFKACLKTGEYSKEQLIAAKNTIDMSTLGKAISFVLKQESAVFWIDNRDNSTINLIQKVLIKFNKSL